MIAHYDWSGGREAMWCFGPDDGPVVVTAPPLFEEANRTRAFIVTMLRALAEQGIASALPDLPGTGESRVATEDATIEDWRRAFAQAAACFSDDGRTVHVASIRGGALIDRDAMAASRWQFAPAAGDALVREMLRARAVAAPGAPALDPGDPDDKGPPLELAGNRVSRGLLRALHVAERVQREPLRVVRLESDPAVADRKLPGAPLWRRAEPDNDPALALRLADDLADWVRQCAA